ncbi:exodeoxyribonuclease III [Elizabethkingia sp. JS20170427COW]|uniref:exodeoxyribonuclease III n=1 Tax=Elizabethkingia sp. JS20170427COW TaxID=2583851 RepID=UPI001110C0AC|nr:exodeoxyribonuclease III [Elizabethkingia sp. JS20170427COW]QCX53551.1 exodeoxyribonuclease III [Elizabethkingia sp. JS20170427COW]
MKIISYNVNGIRAAFNKDMPKWLASANPDVICFQESKAQPEQIDVAAFEELGYQSFWHSAEKKGYSGVGIATKIAPKHIEYGTGIDYIDFEGRVIRADFEECSVISVYVPSATNIDRLDFKMKFCYDFLDYLKELKKEIPNLIVCGDFNICHEEIDIHNPKGLSNTSGFLPIEREYLSIFLEKGAFTDAFRFMHPETVQYSWWSYRANARANNKGWRLDYTMISNSIQQNITRAVILPEAQHSDHCPVMVEMSF